MQFKEYRECKLCPRECGVDRTEGEANYCGETSTCRIGSAEPHFGEEPSFSSTQGSGTIFFSGCSCSCYFCQNHQITQEGLGREVSPDELVDIALDLADRGAHNINYVTPDHFWPHVRYACKALREKGMTIPFIYNSSGYHRADMVDQYAEYVDIFLPDFKFTDPGLAQHCMGDSKYTDYALAALARMIELKGFLEPWDPTGSEPARQGVLVRHLVLPDHIDNSLSVLRLLRKEFGKLLPLSVMSQFHPVPGCEMSQDMTRRISAEEYGQVKDLIEELGFEHVYLQEMGGDDAFLPDFSEEEPFEGNTRSTS